jgi:hypothetical protein
MEFIDAVASCPTLADAQAQVERLWPFADLFVQPKVRSAPEAAVQQFFQEELIAVPGDQGKCRNRL